MCKLLLCGSTSLFLSYVKWLVLYAYFEDSISLTRDGTHLWDVQFRVFEISARVTFALPYQKAASLASTWTLARCLLCIIRAPRNSSSIWSNFSSWRHCTNSLYASRILFARQALCSPFPRKTCSYSEREFIQQTSLYFFPFREEVFYFSYHVILLLLPTRLISPLIFEVDPWQPLPPAYAVALEMLSIEAFFAQLISLVI